MKKPHLRGRFPINTCFVPVNISRHGEEMMASVKGEREGEGRREGREREGGGHLHSPQSVKEKSSCGMNTFVYSFSPSIFSPVGLWLLERRCRLAPSQKESIFLPLLHFSLSTSFSLIQYFLQNNTLPPRTGKECWEAFGSTESTQTKV